MGAESYAREGPPLLERAIASVRERGRGPEGPDLDAGGQGVPLAQHRAAQGARPVRGDPARAGTTRACATPFPRTDVVVVRMNHEDLYAGIEYRHDEDAADELRALVPRHARGRAVAGHRHLPEAAVGTRVGAGCASARSSTRAQTGAARSPPCTRRRSCAYTDGVFLEACREVAAGYPDIEFDDRLVDNVCHQLVSHPAAVRRAAGRRSCTATSCPTSRRASSADSAWRRARTSATTRRCSRPCTAPRPRHAGHDRANPFALMLSGAMLLRHVDEEDAADRLEGAIAAVIAGGPHAHLRPEAVARRSRAAAARQR